MHILLVVSSVIAAWCICGVLAYGFTFAYFQREYPRQAKEGAEEDRRLARQFAWGGPIGLMVALSRGGWRHGILFLPNASGEPPR
jgi:hypothetical protein